MIHNQIRISLQNWLITQICIKKTFVIVKSNSNAKKSEKTYIHLFINRYRAALHHIVYVCQKQITKINIIFHFYAVLLATLWNCIWLLDDNIYVKHTIYEHCYKFSILLAMTFGLLLTELWIHNLFRLIFISHQNRQLHFFIKKTLNFWKKP